MPACAVEKRKAFDDFFLPRKKGHICTDRTITSGRERHDFMRGIQPKMTSVPGLFLHHNFIDSSEEQAILDFLNDPQKCTWRTDLSRRTIHFGGTYCLMPPRTKSSRQAEPEILQAPPMPQNFDWLIQRMVDADVFKDEQRPQYCIVNEYTGSLGISAHTENFQFGEPVVGLSLSSSGPIRFHELTEPFDGSVRSGKAAKAQKTGRVFDIPLPSRSLLVMTGPSRWRWQHEIVRSAKGRHPDWKRVSLTFRFKP
ncbi:MAG: hypothetical protein Q9220_001519 [cf. Caloplaca sp. 1 TL-2023]